jgi:DNA polymerase III delta subunit
MKLHPFRAETLIGQARQWPVAELEDALSGLVDVDATIKGAPGMPVGDAQHRLAFLLWVADRVAPRAAGSGGGDVGVRVGRA